jgi:preprotein translocase subunit SecG
MGVLGIILLVLFCIVSLLLIFLVAIQDEKSAGLGGIFGGSSTSVLGSNTSSFLTKATTVLAVLFMVLAIVVAFINKSSESDIMAAVEASQTEAAQTTTWLDDSATAESTATNNSDLSITIMN